MASLELKGIRKSFGPVPVLEDVSALESREFIAFLGPSGSGKSTLLRIIAGLETADGGEVWLEQTAHRPARAWQARGRDGLPALRALPAHERAREHGVRPWNARIAKDEIERRIADSAKVLEIDQLLDRKPGQMSGGQRQRVALGRALVKHPKLFLLDEPLSNLDAALRLRTRVELAQLKQRVDAAVIMVTHDQAEAMTLADRIVVMNDRKIQQVGPPMEIYSRPANIFVAQFVGSPPMTIAPAMLVEGKDELAVLELGDGTSVRTRVPRAALPKGALRVGIRPEAVLVGGRGTKANAELVERLGERTLVYTRLANGQPMIAEDSGDSEVRIGDEISLKIDGAAAHVFDADGVGYHRSDA